MAVLPMFPLGSVLLPGEVLPLHVFEPRYRTMVAECLAAEEPEFGEVLIERGKEVGGGDVRAMVGVIARMVRVGRFDDGRYAITAVGTRRLRVNAWLPDDPFPVADVDEWPDDDPDPPGLADRVAEMHSRIGETLELATRVGDIPAVTPPEISDDPLLASYHLCAVSPLGPADRYRMLCAPGPMRRLELLGEALDDIDAMLRFRLG